VADPPFSPGCKPRTAHHISCWYFLDQHRVMTTGQLARATDTPERTVRYRLDRLHDAGLVAFARPGRESGSAPRHWWLRPLPVLMPLAPAATLPARAGDQIATVLAAHRVPGPAIAADLEQMRQWRTAATANRSVVGIMNEFAFLADTWRDGHTDLLALALRLATAPPCRPLYPTHGSPDRALAAHIRAAPL
jgi:DNA-binding transcriptional ArsR family regulator